MKIGDMLSLDNQFKLFKELRKQGAVWVVSETLRSMYGTQEVFKQIKGGNPDDEFFELIVPLTHYMCCVEDHDDIYDIARWLARKVLSEHITREDLVSTPNTFLDGFCMEYRDYKKTKKEKTL